MYEDTIFDPPMIGSMVVYHNSFNIKFSLLVGFILSFDENENAVVMWHGPGINGYQIQRHLRTALLVIKDEEHASRIHKSRCIPGPI